jgi:hypothetical protein
MYLVTGDARYYDAVLGSWELCRAHWQQAGGSISIIEFEGDPPNSNYLRQNLGELCGSGFGYFSASASNSFTQMTNVCPRDRNINLQRWHGESG